MQLILDMIQDRMLVPVPEQRSDIRDIIKTLTLICHQYEIDISEGHDVKGLLNQDARSIISHELPFTDSGYGTNEASRTAFKSTESRLGGIQELSELHTQKGSEDILDTVHLPEIGLYDHETAYSMSETPSLPPLRNKQYLIDLASELYEAVAKQDPNQEMFRHISQQLPDLLRAFSLRIGHRAEAARCHIAYFLHKYRR